MAKAKSPQSGGKSTATGTKTAAQRRLDAQRAMVAASGAKAAQRKRLYAMISPIAVILLIVVVLVVVKVTEHTKDKSGAPAVSGSNSVVSDVTGVPQSTLDTIGSGSISTPPTKLTGNALSSGGKPEILYVGAEWCPYCAAERWSLAVALSKFGTLTGLGQVKSSSTDVYPNTNTLTFHGASYSSTSISLDAKEIYSNQALASGNGYQSLDKLTSAEESLFASVGKGSFPFIDIGGKYLISGASYNPSLLQGMTWDQIASALADPTSSIAKAIDGTANVITAAICATTSNAPSAVCNSAGVKAGAASLNG